MTCPTPAKQPHRTESQAWAHVRSLRAERGSSVDVLPYRCECGAWHVGHSKVALDKRIRRALRRPR